MRSLQWSRHDLIAEVRREVWRYLTPAALIETELLEAAALLQLPPQELRTLGGLQFLVSDEVGELLRQMPFLVRRLPTTTANEEEWSTERIRGAIQWARTIGIRSATGLPHVYVTSPARRAYQTAENELLVLVLDAIVSVGRRSGWYSSQSADVGKLVSSRVSEAERWQQTRALLEVERRPMTPSKIARIRSGRHRRRYGGVLNAYERFQMLAERVDRPTIRTIVETRGLVSRDDPTLFELICTFRVLDALRHLGWSLERLGLFAGSLMLRGRKGTETVEVSYQHTPRTLSRQSAYRSLLLANEVPPGPLRPDLVVTHRSGAKESWLLIEAKGGKRAVDDSARAATFDLLAYRAAFAAALEGQGAPFGLGIAWGADLQPSRTTALMLCTPDHVRSAIKQFLCHAV